LLPDIFYVQASKKIKKHKIKFGITLANPDKIKFCKEIDVDFYKIFSRDILDKEIIDKIRSTKKKTYVSTGMSNLNEIKKFIKLINSNKQFTLIHTQLDNDIEKVNLKAILLLKEKFKMNIGYGNHAKNIFSTFVSIAYQPSDYLFYVKGNKIKKHPDEPHAVSLNNLKDFIKNIKDLEKSVGNKTKIKMNANIK
jgi:sialic acid synthase SpsE